MGENKYFKLTNTSKQMFHNCSIPKKEIYMLIKSYWAFPVFLSAYFFDNLFAVSLTCIHSTL